MNSLEKGIILASSLIFVLLTYLTVNSDHLLSKWVVSQRGQSIGQVESVQKGAYYKTKDYISWIKVQNGQPVFVSDRLSTDPFSEVQLKFRGGPELTVFENSLVILQNLKSSLMDVSSGAIALSGFDSNDINLTFNSEKIVVSNLKKNDQLFFEKSKDGSLQIKSTGLAEIEWSGKKLVKKKGQKLVIDSDKQARLVDFPHQLVSKNSPKGHEISWQPKNTPENTFLEVSRRPQFQKIESRQQVKDSSKVLLSEKSFNQYLRLVRNGEILSDLTFLQSSTNSPPVPTFPEDNRTILSRGLDQKQSIDLAWEPAVTDGQLLIKNGTQIISKKRVNGRTTKVNLPPGRYQWEISSGEKRSNLSSFQIEAMPDLQQAMLNSRPQQFPERTLVVFKDPPSKDENAITPIAFGTATNTNVPSIVPLQNDKDGETKRRKNRLVYNLKVPTPLSPEDGTILLVDTDVLQTPYLFSWNITEEIHDYHFQMSKDESFRKMVNAQKIDENFALVTAIPKGVYYWRVRSRTGINASKWSEARKVTIKGKQ